MKATCNSYRQVFFDGPKHDKDGHPRTPKAHMIERFTRPELAKVVVDITIDDPGAYSKSWNVQHLVGK